MTEETKLPAGLIQGEHDGFTIRWLGDLQRLTYQPGDTFILTCAVRIGEADIARLQETWQQMFKGSQLIILAGFDAIGILGPATDPEDLLQSYGHP